MAQPSISQKHCANAIRALTMDAVQRAKSGHPGAPMGMADLAEVLWRQHLRHSPANPDWPNRDRFVLSNGHGSMLIYALLHLSGYDLSIEDIKNFRQLRSKTPGHPEFGHTPGVETTTGPLGQGLANAVGMALAEKTLALQFNRDGYSVIDHRTYVFAGDGCLMEGISHEACSLAGTWKLGKLTVFYDNNGISIDGEVDAWFSDDNVKRFEAYNWQVLEIDGHNPEEISGAIEEANKNTDQPTLISCKTIIGFGSPNKEGTAATHGAPLGVDEIAAARTKLNWPHAPFEIPDEISEAWDCTKTGHEAENLWRQLLSSYENEHPGLAEELRRRLEGALPKSFDNTADQFIEECQRNRENIASRKASQNCLEAYTALLPELIGGSADLTGSNLTNWSGSLPINNELGGNYIYYGVREFGMTAIASGIALHRGFIPFTATFLVFMEYARNATRMAALMNQRSIFVYTHDSIGQGEDGPTHQPIEQLSNLRSTPNLEVWRPCDATETAVAWKQALQRQEGPTALVFSRQSLQHQERNKDQVNSIQLGGYILKDCDSLPEIIIIATGSEVNICADAVAALHLEDIAVRLVSMPCVETFLKQTQDYQDTILPPSVRRRLSVEAASSDYWRKFVGIDGETIGMESFGASAPGDILLDHFGFTTNNVIKTISTMV